MRLGRVVKEPASGTAGFKGEPQLSTAPGLAPSLHVFLELPDHLGSPNLVIDWATSELVEARTYQPYGATESDYRPERWKGFREDSGFSGKEEDIEVGLQYFGKRYLSPYLGRWLSPDPLALHDPQKVLDDGKADFNLYAYVKGAVLRNVDPVGLEDAAAPADDVGKAEEEASKSKASPRRVIIDQFGDNSFDNVQDAIDAHPGYEITNTHSATRDEILDHMAEARHGDIYVFQGHSYNRDPADPVAGLKGNDWHGNKLIPKAEMAGAFQASGSAPSVAILSACKTDTLLHWALGTDGKGVKVAFGIHNVVDMNVEEGPTVAVARAVTESLVSGHTINEAVEAGNQALRNSGLQKGNEVVVEAQDGIDLDKNLKDNGL
jgi:RHS repeat-associated protein